MGSFSPFCAWGEPVLTRSADPVYLTLSAPPPLLPVATACLGTGKHCSFPDTSRCLCFCLTVVSALPPLFFFLLLGCRLNISVQPVKKRCPACKAKLGESWSKILCSCIADLVKKESSSACTDLLTSIKNELCATF